MFGKYQIIQATTALKLEYCGVYAVRSVSVCVRSVSVRVRSVSAYKRRRLALISVCVRSVCE